MEEKMLVYLQNLMNDFQEELLRYGETDRIVRKKMDAMVACKNMVEALINKPITLSVDGHVKIGY